MGGNTAFILTAIVASSATRAKWPANPGMSWSWEFLEEGAGSLERTIPECYQ